MDRHAWDDRYREKGGLLWTAEPNRFVVEVVSPLTAGTAYDLAGGHARNAVWLAEQGWDCTMVDWSEVAIEQGKALAAERGVSVGFEHADLLEWVPSETRDLVLVVYLHLPAEERARVWRTAASAVAPGGTLAIIGHDSSNITEGWGGPQDGRVLYTADEVASVVGDDLTVTRAERVERPVADEDGMHVALDNVVVARRA
jgi:hypothetical protein